VARLIDDDDELSTSAVFLWSLYVQGNASKTKQSQGNLYCIQ